MARILNRQLLRTVLHLDNTIKITKCSVIPIIQQTNYIREYSPSFSSPYKYRNTLASAKLFYCTKNDEKEKPSLFKRFKQMYKDYWYVLLPVHVVTSTIWFGSFYYMAKSGVDIVAFLESWNVSHKITDSLKDSSMGYVAVAYALYKIATPIRYTVTLGGTTISISYLQKWGYIKPVPSPERLKEIYLEKRDNLIETMRETKSEIITKTDKIKSQSDTIIEDLEKSIKKIKETGESVAAKKKDMVENFKNANKVLGEKKNHIVDDLEKSIKKIKESSESIKKTEKEIINKINSKIKILDKNKT